MLVNNSIFPFPFDFGGDWVFIHGALLNSEQRCFTTEGHLTGTIYWVRTHFNQYFFKLIYENLSIFYVFKSLVTCNKNVELNNAHPFHGVLICE